MPKTRRSGKGGNPFPQLCRNRHELPPDSRFLIREYPPCYLGLSDWGNIVLGVDALDTRNAGNWRSVAPPDPLDRVLAMLRQDGIQEIFLIAVFLVVALTTFLALRRLLSRPTAQIIPFDSKTARAVPRETVIIGKAYITDGDTITIKRTQIRLFGIDAPEMEHPYGHQAKWALHSLCKGQTIRAEIKERDRYGRTVARCYLPDGRDLSAEMVRQGLAIDWAKFSGGIYRHLEVPDARRKMFLADARQKGRMHVWRRFELSREGRL